ncbi:MAG: helix-turn-helix domain-containing protein [Clostridiaceae bacterium]|nr:helix-turn-helix domain-containing protein [Clostridiaceae bacterium]
MYLSPNLKYLRESRGLSQEDIAKNVNVSQKAVSAWEHGKRVPKIETIVEIAQYFEVSLDELVLTELKPPIPTYAKNLRYLREKAGFKQEDIAKMLGYKGKQGYSMVETGKTEISVGNLEKISDFFEVTMNQMIKQDLSKDFRE